MGFSVSENLKAIIDSIKSHPNYSPDVKLIAVSKKQPVSKMLEAQNAGQIDFGENYVQEAKNKKPLMSKDAVFHMIGPLQKNKAKYCPLIFDYIHSLCNLEVAKALDKKCSSLDKKIKVLIQMNLDDEPTKSGLRNYQELCNFVEQLVALEHIDLKGLMTIPNPRHSPTKTKNTYQKLKDYKLKIAEHFKHKYNITELSMGMSEDYKIALSSGSTFIRIGSAIFGKRS